MTARDDPPTCEWCGEPKEYVSEPLISGLRGYVCTTIDCGVDG